ncbi:SDR family oxidoreductase [Labrenzia sp. PHM005]|uniref:SDR family oxidoreductase n=1 Tax=Labrenzia sp. PHM005 TaxID=2590016 RepID=UPI0011408323|nr:NmrA family NAD(P)-binding protein [Labrenzia sp. PHM005]QDG78998.1 hypothetical protein FJ695_25755 [Labrenzia sp. PHM005]
MNQTVAVFGATGAQGAPVVREALAKGLSVRAIARTEDRIARMHPEAMPIAAALTDEDAIYTALDGVDAAFLHLPMPTSQDEPAAWMSSFFNAAHRANLPLLVFTTSGPAGERYPSSFAIDGATAARDAVLSSGIPSIVLQPAIYLENLLVDLFVPALRSSGQLDYPPLPADHTVAWISHKDQAAIAVAAMVRPGLAGQFFEIASPTPATSSDLAKLLERWLDRRVDFKPADPKEFAGRVGEALNNPGVAFALGDIYSALAQMNPDGMVVDTALLQRTFGVELTPLATHIENWKTETALSV